MIESYGDIEAILSPKDLVFKQEINIFNDTLIQKQYIQCFWIFRA